MPTVATLALPFFGLIFLGYFCGKLKRLPEEGLHWMNFFIVYIALPALFYKLIVATPFEQLSNWPFILGTTLSTYCAFSLSFVVGMIFTQGDVRSSTMQGILGSYSNVGYMGPGLTLAALGTSASVPTALIFCFDCALMFTLLPFMMAVGSSEKMNPGQLAWTILVKVVTHPFNIATVVGVVAAYFRYEAPPALDTMITFLRNAAAPCALFTLGVTVALRPLKQVPFEVPLHLLMKLVLHPLIVWGILTWIGGFEQVWVYTAVLMASLPPALNVFVMARQYDVYVEQASTGILLGTIVSVFTVTGLLVLITSGGLAP
jgi:malonate transporter and related proteins